VDDKGRLILPSELASRYRLKPGVNISLDEGTRTMTQLVQFFKALSDETRLRIVMLLTQGELCVCDLMAVLGEPQSKVSRHLTYLKYSGLTSSRRAGVWMHYSLNEPSNGIYRAQLNFLRGQLSHLPQFRKDMEKLKDLKKQGGCKTSITFRAAR